MLTKDNIINSFKQNFNNIKKDFHKETNLIGTRYTYIDNFLPQDYANQLSKLFPNEEKIWHQQNSLRERKKDLAKIHKVHEIFADYFSSIQSDSVLEMMEKITGINDLNYDKSLYAGGMSAMSFGDFLNPHLDNSHNAKRDKYRRLNLLYYITPNWKKENGGNFEIWDDKVKTKIEIIAKFNRLVIMETNRRSWHSVNKVKVNKSRNCLSIYLFTKESPSGKDYYHITSFNGRPNQYFRRVYCYFDNLTRQTISSIFKISRGKKLVRD
tara:strand:+ start:96 stop:899 length:804 start_codon:yes stop_codon:yes gene_type:complete